jgi:hypothetical protein
MRIFFVAVGLVLLGASTNQSRKAPAETPVATTSGNSSGSTSSGQPTPDNRVAAQFPESELKDVERFVIATIPDPKLTRLALHFDRWIESLQRAAEASSYTLALQWIPWTKSEAEYTEPGILLFRNNQSGKKMGILLAGESPVSGIKEKQFNKARQLSKGKLVGIVGPSFSGSFKSLEKLLPTPPQVSEKIAVASGSATSDSAITDFKTKNYNYTGFVETDLAAAAAFNRYLAAKDVSFRKSAVLAEGDTAYGIGDTDKSSLRVTFPRDMSVLRHAYDSDQKLRKSITQVGETITISNVAIGKGDEAAGGDSVPIQTPAATAATQELAMQAVAKRLNEDHAAIANVLATNTLDIIFLRQYMATHAPDMQFRLVEPDILFVHQPEVYAFHGSLAVSRYPLFIKPGEKEKEDYEKAAGKKADSKKGVTTSSKSEEAQTEEPVDNNSRIVAFPSKAAEGVYWAARSLIGGPRTSVPPDGGDLWLTIVGLDGYWPVAHFGEKRPNWLVRPSKAFSGLVLIVLLGLLLVSAAILKGRRVAQGRGPRKWLADFHFDPDAPLSFARQYHAYCFVLLVVVLMLLLYRPLALVMTDWIYLSTLPAVVAFWVVRPDTRPKHLDRHGFWSDQKTTSLDRRVTLYLVVIVTAATAFFLLGIFLKVWQEDESNYWATFAAYRSMYLSNGVNPTLPLFLGGLSLLACAWFHFQRFIYASERFVPLELTGLGTLHGPYQRVRDILSRYSTLHGSIAALATSGLVIGISIVYDSALTIEGLFYDVFIVLLFATAAGLTMLSVCQFLQTWWNLSDFLRGIEGLPIRHVFSKMPRDLGSVAMFTGSTRQRSYLYLIKCRDCARLMTFLPDSIKDGINDSVSVLLKRAGADERETGKEAVNVHVSMLEANQFLLALLVKGVWDKGESEMKERKVPHEDAALAEEFVALRFLGFIRYATLQLRNLLTYFSVSFILQAMAISCYPFFSQSLSRLYIGVAFVVLSGSIGFVLLQMNRDATLQRLCTDSEGKNQDHAILKQALQTASLPVLAFASTYFPDLGRSLFSWLLPALTSAK